MYLNRLFKEKMFFLVLFTLPISGFIGNIIANIFNVNDTMGWEFDILNSPIDWISGVIPVLFLVCYGIMCLLKKKTHLFFSKIHLIIISINTMLFSFTVIDFKITYLTSGISLIIFLINIFSSFMNRKPVIS